jgi:hypothetical protein
MLKITTRAAVLGSVAAFSMSGAYAQTDQGPDPEACAMLADELANDAALDQAVRTQVEDVISTGDVVQCELVFTTWEREGTLTAEALALVVTEEVTERMIVQQEVEVSADAAVYQPPVEVGVDTGTPEIVWTMPRQNVTVDEQAPQVVVRQGQPRVTVEVPQPRVTVMIPEPEVEVTWPESAVEMTAVEPQIEVRIPEPTIDVQVPEPIVEMTIGGADPESLVALDDGRYAPQGASAEDLEPRISVQQQDPVVSAGREVEDAEIVFNRLDPVITYEGQEPEVTVDVIGEPRIEIISSGSRATGELPLEDADQPAD